MNYEFERDIYIWNGKQRDYMQEDLLTNNKFTIYTVKIIILDV